MDGGVIDDNSTHLTIAEVARRLRVHTKTVYRLVERGELRGVKVGRVWRVPVSELARYHAAGVSAIDQNEAQALLSEMGERVRPLTDPDAVLWTTVSMLGVRLGVSRCHIDEVDAAADRVTIHRNYHRDTPSSEGVYLLSAFGPPGFLAELRAGRVVVIEDAKTDPRLASVYETTYAPLNIRGFVVVPLLRGNDWVAALVADSATPRDWSADEVALLKAAADRIWPVVENARLHRSMGEQLRERERAEVALAVSEHRIRSLAEHSADAVALLDRTGELIYISPAVRNVLGYTEAEFSAMDPFSVVVPEDLPLAQQAMTRLLQNPIEPVTIQVRARHQDGSERWLELVGTNLLEDPTAQAIVANFRDITVQRQAQDELRISRDQLQAILQSVADGITVQQPSGELLFANDAAAQLIGAASVDALLNTPRAQVLQPYTILNEAGDPVAAEDLPGRRALAERRPAEMVLRYRTRASGEERWSNVRAVPALDENGEPKFAVSAFQDITPLKQAQISLRFLAEASAVLAASLDVEATLRSVTRLAVPALADVCVVDLVNAEGELQRFSVVVPDGVSDQPAWDVGRQPLNPDAAYGPAAVLRTGQPELLPEVTEEILRNASRSPEHLEILQQTRISSHMIVPLRSRGSILGLITFVSTKSRRRFGPRDLEIAEEIAQRAALSIDNARLYHDAKQALSGAEAALDVRDQFLSIASHELRTPLTSLKGHLELSLRRLQRDAPRQDVVHSLQIATDQVNRLNRLVGELLDVSRLAGGRFSVTPEPLDLSALLMRVVEAEQGIDPLRTIQLALPPRPVHATADPSRLEQVIVNLVHNARKYSPEETPILLTLRRVRGNAVITVHDEGIGIPPEDQAMIFTPFHRAANVDRAISGLGLGLYIAHEIVQAHGGALSVESAPNAGSTFTVTLSLPPSAGKHTAGRVQDLAREV
ncbi:MAG: PAS domain S-box protein [Dehalococcoidia bacterium]